MSGPIHVYVDWSKNGTFADTYDDVTSYVRGSIGVTFGRDQQSSMYPMVSGRGTITLNNTSRIFSPRNASGPLFGKLKPNRPVKITRDVTVGGVTTTYTLFWGHTDNSPIDPDIDNRTVTFTLVDFLQDFQRNTISTTLLRGCRPQDALNAVLTAASWTGGTSLDVGAAMFPFWWEEASSAFDALSSIMESEGPPSLLYVDPATGQVTFRDRTHRLVRTRSKTSQVTFTGTPGVEPTMGRPFTYSDNWQNIVNDVTFTVSERRSTVATVVWSTDETVFVGASSSTTILVQTSDPFFAAITPVQDTDYVVSLGSITSVTLSKTSGSALAITYTAGGSGAALNAVQLRAQSAPVVRSWQVSTTDSSSITDYGQLGPPNSVTPEWVTRFDAQDIAAQYVAQRAQPLPVVTVNFTCHHTQVSRLSKVLALQLSDRVTVVEPQTGLSNDFFVETIDHQIDSVAEHTVTVTLEMAPSVPASPFILDSSTLNGSATLGY